MITKKYWNSLEQKTRDEICRIIGVSGAVTRPYHHDFDYDATGKKLKGVLEACNLQSGGEVKVSVLVTPALVTPVIKKKKPAAVQQRMTTDKPKRWKFRRYTQSDPDDGEWVWAHGYTEEEARQEIEHDYWDTVRLECYGLLD